jgi:hypothetical protein
MSQGQVMTLEEIHDALITDHRANGPDGCSNIDRIRFIGETMQPEVIDLTVDYDFTLVVEEDSPILVAAVKHLALLKLDYINRLYDHCHMMKEVYDAEAAKLILAVRRIDHHLSYLEDGLPTPPFSVFS